MARSDLDVRDHIQRYGIRAELVYPGVPTPTVEAAAQAVGVTSERILKSLVYLADGRPQLVIAAGTAPIDARLLRETLAVSRLRLRMATAEEVLELTGFEVGSMPPFAHASPLPTLIDRVSVPQDGELYAGGGTKDSLLRLSFKTLVTCTNAQLAILTNAAADEPQR